MTRFQGFVLVVTLLTVLGRYDVIGFWFGLVMVLLLAVDFMFGGRR